ncbi:MAG: peptide-methionine (S)-S-oxide reductase [Bacteroidetes bacterium]|jgi:peptide-methionine (S)-S-oxide reductase|nr:peptide-methionine (S)-S-oxide reductase [Bacteroidota bacterium]
MQKAIVGGGCFWCIETLFRRLQGVEAVISGYAGGSVPHPSYREVCTGRTGHAEVVQITFDERIITYRDILEIFFEVHDPTTLNRQGGDVGTQYRSTIMPYNDEQEQLAIAVRAERQQTSEDPIVTTIERPVTFYPAEDYHQDYFNDNGAQPYCQAVIAPKVRKFLVQYGDRLQATD